jgi:DNA-binding NarL/FixJ family response regulator
MAHTTCLAGLDPTAVPTLNAALKGAGVLERPDFAALDVRDIGKLRPDLLVCDVDGFAIDRLELLRRLRFVLPDCLIAVYTRDMHRAWSLACHLAGANCMLSKDSNEADLAYGMRDALDSGCFTDPRFSA